VPNTEDVPGVAEDVPGVSEDVPGVVAEDVPGVAGDIRHHLKLVHVDPVKLRQRTQHLETVETICQDFSLTVRCFVCPKVPSEHNNTGT
jgi:hypothetical protein